MPQPAFRTPTPQRFGRLDALRGAAMVWMTVFHFCFDLAYFRVIQANFYADALWTWQRSCIVSLFLLCAGMSQAVALHNGQSWPQFWRRWRQVAGCALLVSAGSYLMFPASFIYFGVLHALAVMLLLLRLGAGLGAAAGRWMWLLVVAVIAIHLIAINIQNPATPDTFLNEKAFNWLGLITKKPITEDYVPLIPWLAATAAGVGIGNWLLAHRRQWLTGPAPKPLAALGRFSLSYYMLHQPVLIGLIAAVLWMGQR